MNRSVTIGALEVKRPAGRRRAELVLSLFFVASALVQPMARILARLDWKADLIAHFCVPGAVMSLLAATILLPRRRLFAGLFGVLAIVQAGPVLRLYGPNPVGPATSPDDRLRVLVANVLVDNNQHDRLVSLIRREWPDVIGLVEVTPTWIEALAPIRDEYPFRYERPGGSDGLALWSRRPLEDPAVDWSAAHGYPSLRAGLEYGGRNVRLWLVHPPSPMHRIGRPGFEELRSLGVRIREDTGPKLVIGDLNTTDGSPHFGDFLQATGLRDSRLGFGAQPSWPTWSPFGITIDHALVPPGLAVVVRRLGPEIGSDHRPFILDVVPAADWDTIDSTSDARASASSP